MSMVGLLTMNSQFQQADTMICVCDSSVAFSASAVRRQLARRAMRSTIGGGRLDDISGMLGLLPWPRRPLPARRADLSNNRIDTFGGHSVHAIATGSGTVDLLFW